MSTEPAAAETERNQLLLEMASVPSLLEMDRASTDDEDYDDELWDMNGCAPWGGFNTRSYVTMQPTKNDDEHVAEMVVMAVALSMTCTGILPLFLFL